MDVMQSCICSKLCYIFLSPTNIAIYITFQHINAFNQSKIIVSSNVFIERTNKLVEQIYRNKEQISMITRQVRKVMITLHRANRCTSIWNHNGAKPSISQIQQLIFFPLLTSKRNVCFPREALGELDSMLVWRNSLIESFLGNVGNLHTFLICSHHYECHFISSFASCFHSDSFAIDAISFH